MGILIIKTVFWIAAAIVIFYMVFPFLTVLASLFLKPKKIADSQQQLDFACIITAYKNIDIALPLVESLLKQSHQKMAIYVVADDCDIMGVRISHPDVKFLKPEQKLSSKVKSIQHGITHFTRVHDAIVIFDPDNLAKADFLAVLNNYLKAGYKAVQGRRTAKNLDTTYACADATGEIYKNYVERQVPFMLGSSPTIAGSGMAVDAHLFNEYLKDQKIVESLQQEKVIAAEDKILQNFLVNKKFQIAFAGDAILYDEKITTGEQVERQRSRWLFSYFENFSNTVGFIFQGIRNFNVNQFLFGLITSTPPLFILLLSGMVLTVMALFISKTLLILLPVSLLIFIGNIFLVLALSGAPKEIWQAVWSLPLFVFRQLLALLKMKQSKKDFLHTRHQKAFSIEDMENSSRPVNSK